MAVSAPPIFPFPLSTYRLLVPVVSRGVPGSSGVFAAPAVPVHPAASVSAPSLFRPFASDPSPSSLPVSSAPPPPVSSGLPSFSTSTFAFPDSSAPSDPSASFSYGHLDDLPEDSPPDAVPRVPAAIPNSARLEFRCMMSFIVDLFPQAAGSPSVAPPPRTLFEDFFSPLLLLLRLRSFSTGLRGSALLCRRRILVWAVLSPPVVAIFSFFQLCGSRGFRFGGCGSGESFFAFSF